MTAPANYARAAARRGAARRARTRQVALDAAERLLSDRPAAAVRMDDIAHAAGVSTASVYAHFGTKDDVIAAVNQRLLDMTMSALRTAYDSDGIAYEQVQAAGLAFMRLLLEHPALTRYLTVNGLRPPETPAEIAIAHGADTLRSEFEVVVQAAVDAGQMRRLNARRLSFFLFGAWVGVAALALRGDNVRLSRDEVEATMLQASELLVIGMSANES